MPIFTVRINRRDTSVRKVWPGNVKPPGFNNRWHAQFTIKAPGMREAEWRAMEQFRAVSGQPASAEQAPPGDPPPVSGVMTTTPGLPLEWKPMSADNELTPAERKALVAEGVRRGFEVAEAMYRIVKKYGYKEVAECLTTLVEALGGSKEK